MMWLKADRNFYFDWTRCELSYIDVGHAGYGPDCDYDCCEAVLISTETDKQ